MYYFYLGDVLLPVTPSKMTTKIKNKNKTLELANGGDLNIPKSPGLTEISFEALLPSTPYSFARYQNGATFRSPAFYIDWLEKLNTERKPFDFLVIRSVSARVLLQYAAKLRTIQSEILRDLDGNDDGRINSADARILLQNETGGMTVLEPTAMRCLLEEYTITEDASRYGRDYLVSIKLKQYREYELKTATYEVKSEK